MVCNMIGRNQQLVDLVKSFFEPCNGGHSMPMTAMHILHSFHTQHGSQCVNTTQHKFVLSCFFLTLSSLTLNLTVYSCSICTWLFALLALSPLPVALIYTVYCSAYC